MPLIDFRMSLNQFFEFLKSCILAQRLLAIFRSVSYFKQSMALEAVIGIYVFLTAREGHLKRAFSRI